jgi:hypothetical protein
LPGTYSKEGIVEKKRLQIKPTDFVSRLFSRREGKMTGEPRQTNTPLLNYKVTTSLPYLDAEIGVAQNGICCSGCRFSFKTSTCSSLSSNIWYLEDKVYSYDGFKEHFQQCQGAQKLWVLSNKGFDVSGVSPRLEAGEAFVKLPGNIKVPK